MTDKNGIRNSDFILMHLLQEADYYNEIADFWDRRGLYAGNRTMREEAAKYRRLVANIERDVERTRRRS